jgi:hypothetical protein
VSVNEVMGVNMGEIVVFRVYKSADGAVINSQVVLNRFV